MKKTILLVCLIAALALLNFPAQAEGEPVLISRRTVPNGGEITVYSDQEIILGAGWGACTIGLVRAYTNVVNLYWEINGLPLFLDEEQSDLYWGPVYFTGPDEGNYCIAGNGSGWSSNWRYTIGTLDPGDYEIKLAQPSFIDGGDYDGDGKIDHPRGEVWIYHVTVHVIER